MTLNVHCKDSKTEKHHNISICRKCFCCLAQSNVVNVSFKTDEKARVSRVKETQQQWRIQIWHKRHILCSILASVINFIIVVVADFSLFMCMKTVQMSDNSLSGDLFILNSSVYVFVCVQLFTFTFGFHSGVCEARVIVKKALLSQS